MLARPSKCLKQIIQIELNRVKNPNWPEANQLAIYKRDRGFELGTTVNKSSWWSERDLNSGPPNCKSSALNTRPRCLLKKKDHLFSLCGDLKTCKCQKFYKWILTKLNSLETKTHHRVSAVHNQKKSFVCQMASIFVFYVSLNIIFLTTD